MKLYIHDPVRATMMEDAPSTMQLDSGAEANQTTYMLTLTQEQTASHRAANYF